MFQRKFGKFHKSELIAHHSVTFQTGLTQKKAIALIMKMGVAAFLNYDNEMTPADKYNHNFKYYNDDRITGAPSYQASKQCCSHTKNANQWYLFPIHRDQLENVGLTEEDLIHWIKYLNSMKCGFAYRYLGAQEGNEVMQRNFVRAHMTGDNTYYWVLVPQFAAGTCFRKTYLHWIALRYLVNTFVSNQSNDAYGKTILGEKQRFGYYNIPRITMMLHEDMGLPKFKAFLYAHLANPFYYYYGLMYSDYDHSNANNINARFDVSVNTSEMRKFLSNNYGGGMNAMLALGNNGYEQTIEILGGRKLTSPFNQKELFKLFDAGDYRGFINHIEESYNPKTKKRKYVRKKKETADS